MTAAWKPPLPVKDRPAPAIRVDTPGSAYCRFDLSEARDDPFTGDIAVAALGPVLLCQIKAERHAIPRLHPMASYACAPYLKIVFQQRGVAHLQQGERRTVIGGGNWTIYDATRPYSIQHVEPLDQFSILIPRDIKSPELETGLRRIPEVAVSPSGAGSVLFGAARSAFLEADCIEPSMRESLGEGLLELAKLALFERIGGASRISMVDTFREKVKRYVRHNLSDNELTVDSIAQALDCSKRYLHKGFAETGSTLSNFIWEERLERARRDLSCRTLANRSITEIAFNWGFVNSAHFSRRFHNRFGMSPRAYRSQALN